MANNTQYKKLTLPLSTDLYDVEIFNNNTKIIDEELHKLDEKNQSQDNLLATKQELNTHVNNKSNPHEVTKSQVGLGNVDNTSDMDKPVSNRQQNAINEAYMNAMSYTNTIEKEIDGHISNENIHITELERIGWNITIEKLVSLEQRIIELENKYDEIQLL